MQGVTIYTDGSCLTNPGRGGYAAIIMSDKFAVEMYGGFEYTTNNRMELISIIRALQSLTSPSKVSVYSDSQYVVNSINNKWVYNWMRMNWVKKTGIVPNADLWKVMLRLLKIHNITFTWIRGHNKNPYNERCDILARQGTMSPNPEIDTGYMGT